MDTCFPTFPRPRFRAAGGASLAAEGVLAHAQHRVRSLESPIGLHGALQMDRLQRTMKPDFRLMTHACVCAMCRCRSSYEVHLAGLTHDHDEHTSLTSGVGRL